MSNSDDEVTIMKTNFTYPNVNDEDLQLKLYKKREFYYNKYPEQPEIKTYQDIKDYRDNICAKDFSLHEYQTLLANLINPDTPMRGAIVFHGLGTGKCILPGSKVNIYINNKLVTTDIEVIWNLYHSNISNYENKGEWNTPTTNLYVDSISNDNGRMTKQLITKLYREEIKSFVKKYILTKDFNL